MPSTEFEQLMADVMSGSENAVWTLAANYTHHIVRVIRRSMSPRFQAKVDPQDIVQSIWVSVLLKRVDLERVKTPTQLINYLARAATNHVIDKVRYYENKKRDLSRECELDETIAAESEAKTPTNKLYSREPSPSTYASCRERWEEVKRGASERDLKILELARANHTFEDIGKMLKINERTARRVIHRLIEQLST
jgi:RNA polymerase sigma-70 factor, ECF subfamily